MTKFYRRINTKNIAKHDKIDAIRTVKNRWVVHFCGNVNKSEQGAENDGSCEKFKEKAVFGRS